MKEFAASLALATALSTFAAPAAQVYEYQLTWDQQLSMNPVINVLSQLITMPFLLSLVPFWQG